MMVHDRDHIYYGWYRIVNGMPGWRYYPEPTDEEDHYVIRIYEDVLATGWSIDIYDAVELRTLVVEDMMIPEHLRDVNELHAWAVSIWRMS